MARKHNTGSVEAFSVQLPFRSKKARSNQLHRKTPELPQTHFSQSEMHELNYISFRKKLNTNYY